MSSQPHDSPTRGDDRCPSTRADHQAFEGPLLTGLHPLPSDPNVRSVRVDHRVVARLPSSDIEALGLRVGMPWTEPVAQAVQRTIEVTKARRDAMGLLGRRAYARAAMEERLVAKGHSLSVARQVTEDLISQGWLNDEASARDLAEQIVARRPAGKKLLEEKLRRHQFDPDLAERIARQMEQEADTFEQALTLAKRHGERLAVASPETAARRIAGLLYRRGFDEDVVCDVLRELGMESPES